CGADSPPVGTPPVHAGAAAAPAHGPARASTPRRSRWARMRLTTEGSVTNPMTRAAPPPPSGQGARIGVCTVGEARDGGRPVLRQEQAPARPLRASPPRRPPRHRPTRPAPLEVEPPQPALHVEHL